MFKRSSDSDEMSTCLGLRADLKLGWLALYPLGVTPNSSWFDGGTQALGGVGPCLQSHSKSVAEMG